MREEVKTRWRQHRARKNNDFISRVCPIPDIGINIPDIGIMVRVFANGPGDLGSISRSSHTKDSKKWYLMPPCLTLSIIRYGLRVKWRNPGKGVAPSPTLWCSSYRKGSLRVTLDNDRQLYLLISRVVIQEVGFLLFGELPKQGDHNMEGDRKAVYCLYM